MRLTASEVPAKLAPLSARSRRRDPLRGFRHALSRCQHENPPKRHLLPECGAPVEQLARLQFAINPQTAQALGLTIPPSVLGAGGVSDRMMDRREFSDNGDSLSARGPITSAEEAAAEARYLRLASSCSGGKHARTG